jgi:hypothetical protein
MLGERAQDDDECKGSEVGGREECGVHPCLQGFSGRLRE